VNDTNDSKGTIFAGGLALVLGAGAFMGVFVYLANSFQYPDVLDGNAKDVLPALLATGDPGPHGLGLLRAPAAALRARGRGRVRGAEGARARADARRHVPRRRSPHSP
jgi:hypothetical protein